MVHNFYQRSGGEDIVFEQDSAMLTAAGLDVRRFAVHNDHIHGFAGKTAAARSVIANKAAVAQLCAEVAAFAPDVVHIHNFFPTLSPAAIDAVARQGIPVVLTLHNYRLICLNALLLRNGKPCEDCVGKSKLPGVIHGCYRGSGIGSAAVWAMGSYVRSLLKKHSCALTLIALTEFSKSRFVADGFPVDSIIVRGNAIRDPGPGLAEREQRIVFVGRLSREKGVDTLVRAAYDVDAVIEIIGDGPERAGLEAMASSNVVFRGHLAPLQVLERIKSATALALPSRCYEQFGLTVVEAMATGTPVLASRLGSLAELVIHEQTGLLVPPDDIAAWQRGMLQLVQSPTEAKTLGTRGRTRFLERHSAEVGVKALTQIYLAAQTKMKGKISVR
jgi:glycosyltransferase involved in cell wall biosynthesis